MNDEPFNIMLKMLEQISARLETGSGGEPFPKIGKAPASKISVQYMLHSTTNL